jgi:hypothetical protein
MDTPRTTWRRPAVRVIELLALGVSLLAAVAAGAWIRPWIADVFNSPVSNPPTRQSRIRPLYDASQGIPRPDAPQREDPREPEPRALEARERSIARDAAAIEAECQRAAGGDWDKWQRDTAAYRADLHAKIDALKELPQFRDAIGDIAYEALEGLDSFPLFEIGSRRYLSYLYDPSRLEQFRRDRAVVAVRQWLRDRGIDLIFVPIPKMTDVYIEHFLDPCPKDGIIAPHVRRTLLELLKEDVEVVDGRTLFRSVRDTDSEYLYNASDDHWAPRAMRVMAKEIADRIQRYKFGARARFGLPIVRAFPGPYSIRDIFGATDYGRQILAPAQAARAARVQTTNHAEVRMLDGTWPGGDPATPVVVIGHSFVWYFREQLIKELNLIVEARAFPDQTTECFADFLRTPEALDHCRVLVWVTTEHHMTRFKPLPGPITDRLKSHTLSSTRSDAPERSSPP